MHEPGTNAKTTPLADLLTIDTLRVLENSEPKFHPSIDIPLARRYDPRSTGNPVAVNRVLTERADSILKREYGVGKSDIGRAVRTLWCLRIGCIGFVTASAAGLCGHLLLARESSQTVSIEGFAWFLGLDLVMAVPPALLMLAGLISPRHAAPKRSASGVAVEILDYFGSALTLFYWVFHAAIVLVQKCSPRPTPPDTRSVDRMEGMAEVARTAVSSHSHLLLRAVAATSHLCWTIVCAIVLVCFLASTTFRDYDFRWHSTWLDESRKLHWLQIATAPIGWLPLVSHPNDQLVRYLSSDAPESADAQPKLDAPAMEAAAVARPQKKAHLLDDIQAKRQDAVQLRTRARAACVDLMAAFLLYYGFLPRVVLAVLARIQFRLSVRRLIPSLTAPYFATILSNLKSPPLAPSPELVEATSASGKSARESDMPPSSESSQISPPELDADLRDVSVSTMPVPPKKPAVQPAPRPPLPSLSVVFSYEIKPPEEGWAEAFGLAEFGKPVDLGNATDRTSRKHVIDEMNRLSTQIRNITIVLDLVGSPDNQVITFIRTALACVPETVRAETVTILTCGDRLRKKYSGNPERVHTHVFLWREEIAKCGIPEEHILEHDHQLATTASLQILVSRLRAVHHKSEPSPPSSSGVRIAGKFPQAKRLVHNAVQTLSSSMEPGRHEVAARQLHQEIQSLYQQEANSFAKALSKFREVSPSLTPIVDSAASEVSRRISQVQDGASDVMQVGREQIEHVQHLLLRFKRYKDGLSGRWAVAFGLAGALAGLSVVGATAVAGLATIATATLGLHVPILAAKLRNLLRSPSKEPTNDSEVTNALDSFSLDDLVRTSVAWALVLELQGNTEEAITHTLQCVLAGCCPDLVDSLAKTTELLDEVEQRLAQVSAATTP